jgi:Family of unknown function (DUF6184)
MTLRELRTAALAVAVAATAACARGGGSEPGATTTSSASANESAAQSIAAARCDREQTCHNIGSGKTYASRNACVDELRDKSQTELRASECPGGVDTTQLDKCLAEVRGEKCGDPLDTLSRITACRTSSLCVK